jgi:GntR family transcriptional regulator, rspAB operon transcriptional repressor
MTNLADGAVGISSGGFRAQAAVDGDSLMEQAYRQLKRDIVELRRPPGDQFTEQAVAAAWELSKTPVREALARLHRDGLVQPKPRSGYVVTAVTLRDVSELCDMRILLQGEAAARTASIGLSPGLQDRLLALSDDHAAGSLAGPDLDARLADNFEFEAIIANGCGSARLTRSVAAVFDEIERVVRLAIRLNPSGPPFRIEQRQAIAEAIVGRDPAAARSAMDERTKAARSEILSALASSDLISATPLSV